MVVSRSSILRKFGFSKKPVVFKTVAAPKTVVRPKSDSSVSTVVVPKVEQHVATVTPVKPPVSHKPEKLVEETKTLQRSKSLANHPKKTYRCHKLSDYSVGEVGKIVDDENKKLTPKDIIDRLNQNACIPNSYSKRFSRTSVSSISSSASSYLGDSAPVTPTSAVPIPRARSIRRSVALEDDVFSPRTIVKSGSIPKDTDCCPTGIFSDPPTFDHDVSDEVHTKQIRSKATNIYNQLFGDNEDTDYIKGSKKLGRSLSDRVGTLERSLSGSRRSISSKRELLLEKFSKERFGLCYDDYKIYYKTCDASKRVVLLELHPDNTETIEYLRKISHIHSLDYTSQYYKNCIVKLREGKDCDPILELALMQGVYKYKQEIKGVVC
ncbi:hypothetical protein [Carp edema virus]|nr:hypothetical protein [Carp edema virus]